MLGSYSDSVLRIDDAIARAKKFSQPGLALTDHGSLAKIYEFYYKAKLAGIKPILGSEIYFVDDAAYNIENEVNERFHTVLLAKNNQGLKNLIKINNESWEKNCLRNNFGLVDWNLLEKYNDGIIALSACLFGRVPQEYMTKGYAAAKKVAERFKGIFGGDFYLEVANHNLPEEKIANKGLIEIGEELDIDVLLTNDVHYLDKEDWQAHDMIIKTRFGFVSDFELDSREYWFKSEEEMQKLGFPQEYLDNTMKVYEKVDVHLEQLQKDEEKRTCFNLFETVISRSKAEEIVSSVMNTDEPDSQWVEKIADIPRSSSPAFEKMVKCTKSLVPIRTLYGIPFSQISGNYICNLAPFAVYEKTDVKPEEMLDKEKLIYFYYIKSNLMRSVETITELGGKFKDKQTYFFAGVIFYRLKDMRQSERFFREYIQRQKNAARHSRAYYFLGLITGDVSYFLKGIISNYKYDINYYGIGIKLFHSNRKNAARQYLKYFVKVTRNKEKKRKAEYLLSKY